MFEAGTILTRYISVETLTSLTDIESNKIIIGNLETLKALIDVIEEGDLSTTSAAADAFFSLNYEVEDWKKSMSLGLAPAVTKNIKAGRNVDKIVHILTLISTDERVIEEMDNLGVIYDLISILRKPSCLVTCEKALVIVYNLNARNRETSNLKILVEEEKLHRTFTKLASQGSGSTVRKAQGILNWIRVFTGGKEPQRP